jgi:RimJ/RimL family protein N-acetyltransferase
VSFEILTDRLRLREWVTSDLEPLITLFSKPDIWHYPLGHGFTTEQSTNFLARQIAAQDKDEITQLAAEDRDTHQLLGYIGLGVPTFLPEIMPAVEIGWRLDPLVWGRGLATEGAMSVMRHAFEDLDLEEVVSIYHPENAASGKIMIHLGMTFDRDTIDPEREIPLRVYRLTKTQWAKNSGENALT